MTSLQAAQSRLWLTQVQGGNKLTPPPELSKAQAIPGLAKTGFLLFSSYFYLVLAMVVVL